MKKILVALLLIGAGVYVWFAWQGFQGTAVVRETSLHLTVDLGAENPNNCYVKAQYSNGEYLTGYMNTSSCYSLVVGESRVKSEPFAPDILKLA